MIEIKTIGVWGFEGSLRGCRMPYESFDKSDSARCRDMRCEECPFKKENIDCVDNPVSPEPFIIGNADMELCKKLIKGGSEHRKFLRMIHVQAEIRAPRYWITELDTYKIGTVRNSSSTMHLITKRNLKVSDFSTSLYSTLTLETIIGFINKMIDRYNYEEDKETKDELFIAIKQLLPESFMQKFVLDCNYECLLNIYHQRKNHRLTEWHAFSDWCLTLPYFKEFVE